MATKTSKPKHFVWLLIAATLSSCAFSKRTCVKYYNKASTKTYDVIIVPGVPLAGDSLQWSRIMKARVYWSKYLFEKGIAKNIMYSGGAVHTPYYEAMIMAMYAEAIGIPKQNILTETKAEHSTENIYYSYKKSRKLGFTTIAIATDPFQSKQMRKFTYRLDTAIDLIPIVFDTLKTMEPAMINPTIEYKQAFKENFISLEEREGFWKRTRGTFGKNIDKHAYD
ncbi:MAG TPA: YdcF family protein [Ferruginibacter sp.]|jgi:uncharacterized SAM-binding protein YcdF (DUF218 family)|nr:YdcF family protein [Ferruginibacter sp.]